MKLMEEHSGHEEAIQRVIVDAFGRNDEARLVDDLRSSGDLVFSIVAEEAGEVCGHVALSRLRSPAGALALAPVSVLKAQQRQGVGSALVRRAVQRARKGAYEIIFVLGAPLLHAFWFYGGGCSILPMQIRRAPLLGLEPHRTQHPTGRRCLPSRLR